MRDMSMKKLLDILSYDQNIIKVNQAKAELLRRHEALEKELESWRGSRDGVLQHIDEMSYEIESLKCCGNCKHDNDTPTDTAEDHYCYDCENNNKWEKRL